MRLALVDVGGGGDAKESYREYHSSEASTAGNRPQLTIRYGSTTPPGTTIDVPAGGDLQAALNQAQPGTTIRLAAGATYTGNFRLPAKGGTSFIVITTNTALPAAGTRIDPSYRTRLATIKSPNGASALATASGASYYRIVGVGFDANLNGDGEVIALGRDDQTTLAEVPHHIELDRVLITGDAAVGQRRGIAVNAAHVDDRQLGHPRHQGRRAGFAGHRRLEHAGTDHHSEQLSRSGGREHPLRRRAHQHPERHPQRHPRRGQRSDEGPAVARDVVDGQEPVRAEERAASAGAPQPDGVQLERRTGRVRYRADAPQPSGRTPWVVVEDVEFSSNIIRSASSVFNILGHDDTARSGQLARLLIRTISPTTSMPATGAGLASSRRSAASRATSRSITTRCSTPATSCSSTLAATSTPAARGSRAVRSSASCSRTIWASTTATASSAAARARARSPGALRPRLRGAPERPRQRPVGRVALSARQLLPDRRDFHGRVRESCHARLPVGVGEPVRRGWDRRAGYRVPVRAVRRLSTGAR